MGQHMGARYLRVSIMAGSWHTVADGCTDDGLFGLAETKQAEVAAAPSLGGLTVWP